MECLYVVTVDFVEAVRADSAIGMTDKHTLGWI